MFVVYFVLKSDVLVLFVYDTLLLYSLKKKKKKKCDLCSWVVCSSFRHFNKTILFSCQNKLVIHVNEFVILI